MENETDTPIPPIAKLEADVAALNTALGLLTKNLWGYVQDTGKAIDELTATVATNHEAALQHTNDMGEARRKEHDHFRTLAATAEQFGAVEKRLSAMSDVVGRLQQGKK